MTNLSPVTLDCIILGLQRFGGISNYWYQLVRELDLSPAPASGLVLPARLTYRDYDPQCTVGRTVIREHWSPTLTRYLPSAVLPGSQVLHTSYYRTPAKPVGKYLVSVYDFTYERYRSGLARWVHSAQKLRSIQRADAVLCISDSTRDDVLEFCPGVDPARLHVIPLGLDSSMFFPDVGDGHTEFSDVVLFVGQRGGYKRFDLAVDALKAAPHLRLGVVGPALTAEEKEHLTQILGARWHEFGPVSTAALRKLYASAYAFVFPSDYEGFGLPILEAMACGCPVVAARRSSLPEVGGNAACYADVQAGEEYAAALSKVASTHDRMRIRADGFAHASAFSWARTFRETASHYVI